MIIDNIHNSLGLLCMFEKFGLIFMQYMSKYIITIFMHSRYECIIKPIPSTSLSLLPAQITKLSHSVIVRIVGLSHCKHQHQVQFAPPPNIATMTIQLRSKEQQRTRDGSLLRLNLCKDQRRRAHSIKHKSSIFRQFSLHVLNFCKDKDKQNLLEFLFRPQCKLL